MRVGRDRRGFTLGRVAGGDHDHRHFDFVVAAGRAGRPRGRPPGAVRQQPEADRPGRLNFEAAHQKLPTGGEGNGAGTVVDEDGLLRPQRICLPVAVPGKTGHLRPDQPEGHVPREGRDGTAATSTPAPATCPPVVCPSNPFVPTRIRRPRHGDGSRLPSTAAPRRPFAWTPAGIGAPSDYFATVYTSISDGSNSAIR